MGASPSFAHLVRDTAKLVSHPAVANSTLWDARNDRGKFYGNLSKEAIVQINAEMDAEITDNELSSIRPLGSGSDFTVFLQRIGVRLLDDSFILGLTCIPPDRQPRFRVWFNAFRCRLSLPFDIRFGALDGNIRRPRFCQTRTPFLTEICSVVYNCCFQVAVAQHLGLQTLRLADSWVLPINTTHYSIELQSYLDKSVSV